MQGNLPKEGMTYSEHHGILEFYEEDWANPSQVLPNLVRINKSTKRPVAFYRLRKQEIRFSSLFHTEKVPPLARPYECSHQTIGGINILKGECANSIDQLPPFGFGTTLKKNAWRDTVAFTTFEVGEVTSERLSEIDGRPVPWEFRRLGNLTTPKAKLTRDETEIHFINLDLRISYLLELRDSLVIELFNLPDTSCDKNEDFLPTKGATDTNRIRSFILHPENPNNGLTVWMKNRELEIALHDSDLLPDPYTPNCRLAPRLDRDHGLLAPLASKAHDVIVPFSRRGGSAQCGQGCGGCKDC